MKGYTKQQKEKEIIRRWYFYDARGQALGRLAVKIAKMLMGKNQVGRSLYLDNGHFVVVINTGQIKVGGGKEKKKIYYRYTGYPGGLRRESYADLFVRRPDKVLRLAVAGMLPENKQKAMQLRRLFIYPEDKYPQKVKFANLANAVGAANK